MAADVRVLQRTDRGWAAFADRSDAGRVLAAQVAREPDHMAVVLALPRGGVPVGVEVAAALGCELRPVAVRKLPLPSSPEMGFGAVTVDGTTALNHAVMRRFGVTMGQAAIVTEQVRQEVIRRAHLYPGAEELPLLTGRRVIIVDDGLATGYTMIATAEMVRHQDPGVVEVAIPCAPASAVEAVSHHCDALLCLVVSGADSFAVASFYESFPDLTDEEVVATLLRAQSGLA